MAQKKLYYVGVRTENGMRFVTGIGEHSTAYWNRKDRPKAFPKTTAEEICTGLCMNFFMAVVVESMYGVEFEDHYFEKAVDVESEDND